MRTFDSLVDRSRLFVFHVRRHHTLPSEMCVFLFYLSLLASSLHALAVAVSVCVHTNTAQAQTAFGCRDVVVDQEKLVDDLSASGVHCREIFDMR